MFMESQFSTQHERVGHLLTQTDWATSSYRNAISHEYTASSTSYDDLGPRKWNYMYYHKAKYTFRQVSNFYKYAWRFLRSNVL